MGGVRGELLLRLEIPLQPLKHPVESARKLMELVPVFVHGDPAGQVPALADLLGGFPDHPDRLQGLPGQQIPADGREQDKKRYGNENRRKEPRRPDRLPASAHGSADPDIAALLIDFQVVDEIFFAVHGEFPHGAFAEGFIFQRFIRHLAAPDLPVLIENQAVDAVPVGDKVLADDQLLVPVLHALCVFADAGDEGIFGVPAGLGGRHKADKGKHDPRKEQHKEHEPERQFHFDGQFLHSSTFSE